jgi:hypothetical protein
MHRLLPLLVLLLLLLQLDVLAHLSADLLPSIPRRWL